MAGAIMLDSTIRKHPGYKIGSDIKGNEVAGFEGANLGW
jgi:hypothetical protein